MGDEALQKATDENKPILCEHWLCHHWRYVMERESFEDEPIYWLYRMTILLI